MKKLSLYILAGVVLLLPLFVLPTSFLPVIVSKAVLLTLGVTIPLLILVFHAFSKKEFTFPKSDILIAGAVLPVVYAISYVFTDMQPGSFSNLAFSVDTVVVTALFALTFLVFALSTNNTKTLAWFTLRALFSSFILIGILLALQAISGAGWLPSIFALGSISLLGGSLQDLAFFAGLIVVLSLATHLGGKWRYVQYVALLLAVIVLALTNVSLVWISLATLSALYALYSFSVKKVSYLTIAVFVLSIIFVVFGGFISTQVNKVIRVDMLEVRPSWSGSLDITRKVYKDNALFGAGPNTFAQQWASHKDSGVNTSIFWSADFNQGIGFIPTKFTTVGVIGGLAWVLFLLLLLKLGYTSLWHSDKKRGYTVVLFTASLYLWVLAVFSVPNIVLLGLACILTGLLVAEQVRLGRIRLVSYDIRDHSAGGFAALLVAGGLVVVSLIVIYFASLEAVTSGMLSRANVLFNDNQRSAAVSIIKKVAVINDSETVASAQTRIALADLQDALQVDSEEGADQTASQEKVRTALSATLSNAIRATTLHPSNYRNWLQLASIYSQIAPLGIEGSKENADRAFAKATELNPSNPSIPLAKARLALTGEDVATARTYIAEALALKPNYTEAHYLRAQIEIAEGNTEKAIESTEAAALLNPNNAALLFQLGVLQYNAEEFEKAQVVLERAVVLNRSYANALYFLGLTYNQLGNQEGALAAFSEVARLNPENEEVAQIVVELTALVSAEKDNAKTLEQPDAQGGLPIEEATGAE
jgi:tetratricopeptide (TPR) repeat protein